MRKSFKQTLSSFISTFFVASQIIFPVMAAQPVSAVVGGITIADHEGQLTPLASDSWSNGNIKTYSEGESINFRFDVTGAAGSVGTIDIEYAEDDGKCLFFDGTFNLGTHDGSANSVENTSGISPLVSTVGIPQDGGIDWVQTVQFDFTGGAGSAEVYYYLTLSNDAGACVGSSTHTSFGDEGGDVSNTGSQEVSIPAKDVLVLPDITITKRVDDDGDNQTERTAAAGEWDFQLNDGTSVPTDAIGTVVFTNVPGGDHTITELNGPDGYIFFGDDGDCDGEVVDGVWNFTVTPTTDTADITCEFWNQALPDDPTITLEKVVIGGEASEEDFTLLVNEEPYAHGDVIEAESATEYYFGEGFKTDYTLTSIVCTENGAAGAGPLENDPLILEPDQHVTCVWTNTYVPPVGNITVTKVVNNNHQGTAVAGDFTLLVGDTEVESGAENEFPATVEYTVSEEQLVGYQQTSLVCVDANSDQDVPPNLGATFTLERNQNVECTITNEDIPYPELTIIKRIINDDGRSDTLSDFTLYLNGDGIGDPDTAIGSTTPDGSEYVGTWDIGPIEPGSAVNVTEDDPGPNYQLTSTMCFLGDNPSNTIAHPIASVDYGDVITCVLTNNDTPIRAGTIEVVKRVENDDGGTLVPANFPLFVNNTRVMSGDTNQFQPGEYTVSEIQQEGYRLTSLVCRDVASGRLLQLPFNLAEDQQVRCVLQNTDLPAKVTVYKRVINDNGGQAGIEAFDLFINDREVNHGQTYFIDANRWLTIGEQPAFGYEQVGLYCQDVTGDQNVNPLRFRTENGHEYRCLIVNDDIPPMIKLTKTVINDHGGELEPEDFQLMLNRRQVPQDRPLPVPAGVEITPWEQEREGYKLDSLRCYLVRPLIDVREDTIQPNNDNGHEYLEIPFTLRPGQRVHCEFVNDDIPAVVVVEKMTYMPYSEQEWNFRVGNNGERFDRFTLDTAPWTDEFDDDYTVKGLSAGMVRIAEQPVEGWINGMMVTCSYAHLYDDGSVGQNGYRPFLIEKRTTDVRFKVELGDVIVCRFLNVEKGDVKVTKFHDANENGYFDKGEETLPGWDMTLDAYRMRICNDRDLTRIADGPCDTDTIVGVNGNHYDREPDRSWTQTTDDEGMTTFEDLWPAPLAFYQLSETEQEGWHQTNIYCRYNIALPGVFDTASSEGVARTPQAVPFPGRPMGGGHVMVIPGLTTECFVGNTYDPVLTIEKYNDQPEPTVTGETVEYTIVVSVPEESGCVYRESFIHHYPVPSVGSFGEFPFPPHFGMSCETDEPEIENPELAISQLVFECFDEECEPNDKGMEVTVTDLPPEGFEYVPGSWTSNSSVRGDLKAAGITTEPGYASPGQWYLTSPGSPFLVPGEVITLTYNTVIDNAVTNGTYPDAAFVEGFTSTGERIFGNLHFTDTPFVGTQVEVLEVDPVTGGFVLGVLSETGNPAILAPIAGILISAGALLTGRRRKEHRWLKKIGATISGSFAALALTVVFATSVMAAGFWNNTISVPNPFTTIATVNVDYTVSSTEPGDDFTVTLKQNGAVVDSQVVTAENGDSGRFARTLPSEGDYTFQTVVENTTQGGTQSSAIVAVQYDATAPLPATFGTTERVGNTYTVNFTAPTGDVDKVNVYASTSKTFDLDSSTLVGSVDVTPGETTSFNYVAPDSTQRYFAVLAVDDAGNQSSAVGDAEVQLIAAAADGTTADPAVLDSDGDGVVDADDSAPFDPEVTGTEADDSEGQTAGATDDDGKTDEDDDEDDSNAATYWVIAAAVAGLGILYYFYNNRAAGDDF